MTSLKERLKQKSMTAEYSEISKSMDETPREGEEVVDLDTQRVSPNPFQYRIRFDAQTVEDLGKKIRRKGQLQPIGVRKVEDRYQIIWGEHRWRACALEGLKVKALVREATDEEMAELCFAENHDRTNPTAYEDYNAILIQKKMGKSPKDIQASLGLRAQDYYKLLTFENFPEPVIDTIKAHLDVIGKTEAEALGTLCGAPDFDAKKFSDVVCDAIARFANNVLPTRKAMIAFIKKELKPAVTPKPESKQESSKGLALSFEGSTVGTLEVSRSGMKISISKEDLPQDRYEQFESYVKEFFQVSE